MGNLPKDRITPAMYQFHTGGIDFAGPFLVWRGIPRRGMPRRGMPRRPTRIKAYL